MTYRLLADAVIVFHLAFIVFAVAGGFLALRWRWMPWLHLPALGWGATVEMTGWLCPLTPLENALRAAGGGDAYAGGFIERYLVPVIYPAGLTRDMQWTFAAILVAVNVVTYGLVWRQRSRGRSVPVP